MQNKNILIVEDENIIALDIKNRLNNLGYRVTDIISNGEVAVNKIGDICPDLIFMDIRLNGKYDGIETAKRIRADYKIPVIYLSAYTDDKTLNRAKKVTNPFFYLQKPFLEDELTEAVQKALQGGT